MSLIPFQDPPCLFQKRNLTQPLSIVFPLFGQPWWGDACELRLWGKKRKTATKR